MQAPDPRQNPNYAKEIQKLEALNPEQLAYMGPAIAAMQGIDEDVRNRLTIARLGASKQSREKHLALRKETTAKDFALTEKGQAQRYDISGKRLEESIKGRESSEKLKAKELGTNYYDFMQKLGDERRSGNVQTGLALTGVPIAGLTAMAKYKTGKEEAQFKRDIISKLALRSPTAYNYVPPPV